MTISPSMLLFCIFDSIVAFFLVYHVLRAKLGGNEKKMARVISVIVGTIVAAIFFAATIWFNTERVTVSMAAKMVVYLAPIVLSILMIILVLLTAPPVKKEEAPESEENSSDSEATDSQS